MTGPAYRYRATVLRWIDGDTVELDVDLGFTVRLRERFRLLGIDTPERGREGYAEACSYVAEAAPAGSSVTIESTKTEKFGRWLAIVWTADLMSVNAQLLATGLARVYDGGTR